MNSSTKYCTWVKLDLKQNSLCEAFISFLRSCFISAPRGVRDVRELYNTCEKERLGKNKPKVPVMSFSSSSSYSLSLSPLELSISSAFASSYVTGKVGK